MAGPSRRPISSPLTRIEQLKKSTPPRKDFSSLDLGNEYLEDIAMDSISSGSSDYYPIYSPSDLKPAQRSEEPFDWGFLGDVQPFPREQSKKTKRVSIQSPSGQIRVPGISSRPQFTRPGSTGYHQLTRVASTVPSTPTSTRKQPHLAGSTKKSQTPIQQRKIAGSVTPVPVRRPSKPRI